MNNIYQELQNEFAKGNYYSAISKALLLLQIEKGKETYLLANIILARSYFNLGMINDSIIPTLELCKYQIQASRGIAVDIIEYLGKNGQWNEAVNFAHEVLSVDPKNYAAARKCIRILLNIGDHEIAAILFNNYKTTSPTISTIFSSYFSSPQETRETCDFELSAITSGFLTGLPVITSDSWAASDCEYRLSGRKAQPLEYFLTRSHLSRYDCILSIGSDFLYLETICCQLNPQAKFVLYLQERVLIDIANEAFESILGNNKVEIFRDISAKKIQNIITRNTLVLIHIDQFSSEVIALLLSHLDPLTLLMYGSSELGENIFRDDRRLWWRTRDGSKASEPETFWYLSISLNVAD